MDTNYYELEYRKSQTRLYIPGLPAEFKPVLVKIPYTSTGQGSKWLLLLADQLIKAGNALKKNQLKLSSKEIYQ